MWRQNMVAHTWLPNWHVGLSVSSLDANGRIPLISAAIGGQAETVKLLLQLGSDVNAQDKEGLVA
jgi:ankyrin repeat protein